MKKVRTGAKSHLTPRERRQRSLAIQLVTKKVELQIVLKSHRAYRVSEPKTCDSCNTRVNLSWRYAESNRGTVYICDRCKSKIYIRSFGEKDAMNVSVQGGQFESNRRKH